MLLFSPKRTTFTAPNDKYMKQVQKLTMEDIFQRINHSGSPMENIYFDHQMATTTGLSGLNYFIQTHTPFMQEDYRMGILKKGKITNIINLQEHTITPGTAVFITPGSIIELIDMTDNAEIMGVNLPSDLFHVVHQNRLPTIFNSPMKDGQMILSPSEQELLFNMFHLLFNLVKSESAGTEVVSHQIAAITYYYNDIFQNKHGQAPAPNSANELFDKFIDLVNHHCHEHRQLAFYAGKLCITERYLSTIVRQTSGTSAKEWIDKAVITSAKVKLRYNHAQIVQIADELNFPTPSFFCKYFKRHVGCTPQTYRKNK